MSAFQLRLKPNDIGRKSGPNTQQPASSSGTSDSLSNRADRAFQPLSAECGDLEPELRNVIRILRRMGYPGSEETLVERAKLELAMLREARLADGKGLIGKLFSY